MNLSATFRNRRALPAALVAGLALSHASALLVYGQAQRLSTPATIAGTLPIDPASAVRSIGDPSTGHHWLLLRNPALPGGPGLLVPGVLPIQSEDAKALPGTRQSTPSSISLTPVIRAGDRILLESHSTRIDTWLEAVALEPARLGSLLRARLLSSGRTVRAVASGPGRASLAAEPKGWLP